LLHESRTNIIVRMYLRSLVESAHDSAGRVGMREELDLASAPASRRRARFFYKAWPTTDEAIMLKIARQEEQATSIDVIELAGTGEFCSREQQALARRVSGVAVEGDEDVAAPVFAQFPKTSTAYGMIALEKALYLYSRSLLPL